MSDDNNHNHVPPSHPSLAVLWDRQRQIQRRLDEIETKQKEAEKLVNRYIGGIAILTAVGVFIGWVFTAGSSFLQIFRR